MLNSIKIWHSGTSTALKHSDIKHLHCCTCGKRFDYPAWTILGKPQPISTYTKMQFTKYFEHCRMDLHSFEIKVQKYVAFTFVFTFCCSSLSMKLKIRYKQKASLYMCTVTHKICKLHIQTFNGLEGKCELWNISRIYMIENTLQGVVQFDCKCLYVWISIIVSRQWIGNAKWIF